MIIKYSIIQSKFSINKNIIVYSCIPQNYRNKLEYNVQSKIVFIQPKIVFIQSKIVLIQPKIVFIQPKMVFIQYKFKLYN